MATVIETFDATTTWTCPADVTLLDNAEAWGPGCDGDFPGLIGGGGSGGGSGAYAATPGIVVVPGNSYAINAPAASLFSLPAGNSYFDSGLEVKANGALGGIAGGDAATSVGTTKNNGANGGSATGNGGAGGAGSGGVSGAGNPGDSSSTDTGGNGGAALSVNDGAGGRGGDNTQNGANATAPGAGGGGAGAGATPGAGKSGRVRLTYQVPDPPVVVDARPTTLMQCCC